VSLILDALRKADAERERGNVPSLHSQPVVSMSAEAPLMAQARPKWLWIAIGLAAGLAAAAMWVVLVRDTAGPATAVAVGAPPVVPVAQPMPPPAAEPRVDGVAALPAAAARIDSQPAAGPAPWPQPEQRRPRRHRALLPPTRRSSRATSCRPTSGPRCRN
jgi:general secretion pathway protein B